MDAPPAKGGPSLVIQLGVLVVLTAAAAGMGWFSGGLLTSGKSGEEAHAPAAGGHGTEAKEGGHEAAGPASETVIALPAITTNIASPPDVWVRMEVSLVLDAPPETADLAGAVSQDLIAYIRTIKMHEIEGASGFRHLRENLDERASIRSDGHVKQVLIRTLLFE
ncbi:flagellar basal body-associated FliL family protein [Mesorhizobium sp. VNQ89]|uniref:flagellar basal body-associated FliL family protein n=1 Tax=Mesorhizobium quangtriensis TaxID=3157709 RepID=UPI0032B7FC03